MTRLPILAVLVLCSILLTGCYGAKMRSVSATQAAPNSPTVTLTTDVCILASEGDECSADTPLDAEEADEDTTLRYTASALVPIGTTAPAQLTTHAGRPLTFVRNANLESVLAKSAPIPGQVWIAYTTGPGAELAPSPDFFQLSLPITLPTDAAGAVTSSQLDYRFSVDAVALGNTGQDPAAPVACIEQLHLIGNDFAAALIPCTSANTAVVRGLALNSSIAAPLTAPDLCSNADGVQAAVPFDMKRVGATCVSKRFGTNRADVLPGTSLGELLFGLEGNDIMTGGAGNDIIAGHMGNDRINAGPGADMADSAEGADRLLGGAGNDKLYASSGNDLVDGGPGVDFVEGGDGRDVVRGGAGNDQIDAFDDESGPADGRDTVDGGPGRDRCIVNVYDRVRGCEKIVRRAVKD